MRVGFVGLGTMGGAMAANVAMAGYQVTAWNRTPGRAADLHELGVELAASPAAVASASDIIVTIVSDTPDVEAVLFGEGGVAAGAPAGSLVIDMSTISPSATRDFAARLAGQGVGMLDAPVSGGSEGAKKGTLSIFVGGEAADFERARPVLAAMGTTITHVGPIGSGQAVKAVNQVILAGTYLGVAEGVVLAIKAGLDVEQVVAALSGGAAQSWVLANRSGRMLANDYPLGFKVALHRKDLGIALQLARETGTALPISALCEQIEVGLIGKGARRRRHVRGRAFHQGAVGPRRLGAPGPGPRPTPACLASPAVDSTHEEHRRAEPAVVAGPEPFDVVHRVDIHAPGGHTRGLQIHVGVLPVADRHHVAERIVRHQVHRHVRERRSDDLVECVRLAGAQVVGQLDRERRDARPGLSSLARISPTLALCRCPNASAGPYSGISAPSQIAPSAVTTIAYRLG